MAFASSRDRRTTRTDGRLCPTPVPGQEATCLGWDTRGPDPAQQPILGLAEHGVPRKLS